MNQKAFFKQISANPKVESVASFEDHSWLRVTGTLSVPRCQKKLQETYLSIRTSLQKIYKAGDGIFEVLELKNPVAELHPYGGGEVQHIKD